MTPDQLRAHRETIVREHMADEIDHAWDKVLATLIAAAQAKAA
jgi:hypothetical protein